MCINVHLVEQLCPCQELLQYQKPALLEVAQIRMTVPMVAAVMTW